MGRNIYGKVCRDMVEVHDEQQQVSLKFAQECILLMFIKAPSVDIGIHQIEESPLRDGLFFIAKSQQPFINAV